LHERKVYDYSGLYALSKEAYQTTIELLPENADWRYGYADLLCTYAEWNIVTREDWVACVGQVKLALEINPGHEKANELLQWLNVLQDLVYFSLTEKLVDLSAPEPIYLILTPQPTPTQTQLPPTQTSTPQTAPTSTQESSPAPSATQTATQTAPEVILSTPTDSETASQPLEATSGLTVTFLVGLGLVLVLAVWRAARKKV